MKDRYKRGSFTIEAAIIIPFILFLMITVLQIGIKFYQESSLLERSEKWEAFHAVSMFYKLQILRELGNGGQEDGL